MLKIQEELGLRDTAFYREAFEEGRLEGREEGILKGREEGILKGREEGILKGREEGILKGKLDTVPLLRELGLSDEVIANRLGIALTDVRRVPRSDKRN